VRALDVPLARGPGSLFHGTPVPALAALIAAWALAVLALPEAAARVVGLAAAHGALLGTALAWTTTDERRDRWAPVEAALVLGAAAACARVHPAGALAYVAVPVWLGWRRRSWLGAGAWRPAGALAGGAVFGLLLGAHLLVNTSLTFGYRVRTGPLLELAAWWAYDLGANVLAAELFFRGALFERAYRRWSFAPAAAVSTGAALTRYLLDPLLPHSVGIAAGATFYLAMLGAGSCWLVARTGALGPSLTAASFFFVAYRLLAPR
jgi:membrane protease YdiL (CAAX protease family)